MLRLSSLFQCLFVAVFLVALPLRADPVGNGFTYQGVIKLNGVPINGSVDLRFTLWDASGVGQPPAGGAQVGQPATSSAVMLNQGSFSVKINQGNEFGGAAFNGNAPWIQIGVRSPAWNGQGGEPAFLIMGPRQEITPSPYALHALNVSADVWGLSGNIIYNRNDGPVGVGTPAPEAKLEVFAGASESDRVLRVTKRSQLAQLFYEDYLDLGTTSINARGEDVFGAPGDRSLFLNNQSTGNIIMGAGGGSVGIGLSNPIAPLHVRSYAASGNAAVFDLLNPGSSGFAISATCDGAGAAILAAGIGTAEGLSAYASGTGNAIQGAVGVGGAGTGRAGYFVNLNDRNTSPALECSTNSNSLAFRAVGNAAVTGDVLVGPANLQAAAGPERLAIVRGTVSQGGTVVRGSGFTASRVGEGSYIITFTTNFVGDPSVTSTAFSDSVDATNATIFGVGPGWVHIVTWSQLGQDPYMHLDDRSFSFIAIGSR